MKHIVCLWILSLGFALQLFSQGPDKPVVPGWSPLPNLTIGVQEGIELMSVIQYLGGHLENNTPSPYKNDVRRYFTPYRNHPAVLAMFNFDYKIYSDFVECGLTFYDLPQIHMRALPDSSIWYKSFSKDSLTQYLRLCMDFYRDTKFHQFYLAHQEMYHQWANGLAVSIREPIRIFDSLIDVRQQNHWLICMDPLNDWGAHTIMPNLVNPAYEGFYIYQLGYFGGKDSSGNMSFHADLYNFAWHEGTHACIEAILKAKKASIDSFSYLMPHDPVLAHQNIDDWDHYFDELIPNAVSLALCRQFKSPEEYEKQRKHELQAGFVHASDVADLIYTEFVHNSNVNDFSIVVSDILVMLRTKYPH